MTTNTQETFSMTLPSATGVRMVRVFHAPRALVFEAHTTPEHIRRWWGPRNTTLPICELDFRPGGKWRFVMRMPDGAEMACYGEYREIVPPEQIAYTFECEFAPGQVLVETLTFTEADGRTTLTSVCACSDQVARDAMIAHGMEAGARESWDRLAEAVERRP